MTIERMKNAASAKPFRAFYVCLANGRKLRVSHPEQIWIPPKAERTFIIGEGGEDYRIIDLLLVTSLDYVNGRPRRRSIH